MSGARRKRAQTNKKAVKMLKFIEYDSLDVSRVIHGVVPASDFQEQFLFTCTSLARLDEHG